MQVQQKSVDSFLESYSSRLQSVKELNSDVKTITADDVITLNKKACLERNKINYCYADLNTVKNMFLNQDYNESINKISAIINEAQKQNNKVSIAANMICSLYDSHVFAHQNEYTSVSSGLFYLYKNNIDIAMNLNELGNLSYYISVSLDNKVSYDEIVGTVKKTLQDYAYDMNTNKKYDPNATIHEVSDDISHDEEEFDLNM